MNSQHANCFGKRLKTSRLSNMTDTEARIRFKEQLTDDPELREKYNRWCRDNDDSVRSYAAPTLLKGHLDGEI